MNLSILDPADRGYPHPEYLVTTQWLEEHLDDPAVRIVDMDRADAYPRVHIPGAVNAANQWLKRSDAPAHVLPAEAFAEYMAALGIGDDMTVVAYDSDACHNAARLFWALWYYGHQNVKLLDGGFPKWFAEGRRLDRSTPEVPTTGFTPRVDAALIALKQDVLADTQNSKVTIWDVRTDDEWLGLNDRGTARGGHVPNAVHLEWRNLATKGDVPVIKPAAELKKLLAEAGIVPEKRVVSYCQAGVRASHGFFVLKLLGYEDAGVYDASWLEWGNALECPIVREA